MDSELRQYLDDIKAEIISTIMERIDGRIDASEERMKDFIRKADFDLETKLVAEFWKWGRSSDVGPAKPSAPPPKRPPEASCCPNGFSTWNTEYPLSNAGASDRQQPRSFNCPGAFPRG